MNVTTLLTMAVLVGWLATLITQSETDDVSLADFAIAVSAAALGGGLLAAVLIVVGTPHVAWYIRAALAVIAFAYIAGQSAAYLWSSNADQG